MFESKAEAKRVIQASIDTNDRAVYKAMRLIFEKQTSMEQAHAVTHDANNVGFSGCDAEIMTSFVRQLNWRGFLTPKQLPIARKKMRKYWKQLAHISGNLA